MEKMERQAFFAIVSYFLSLQHSFYRWKRLEMVLEDFCWKIENRERSL